jgi:hypothetical protein
VAASARRFIAVPRAWMQFNAIVGACAFLHV